MRKLYEGKWWAVEEKSVQKTVAHNKKAYYEYFVLESYEAGIELFGTEVKSIRQGQLNLRDAWCGIVNGEIFLNGMHVSPYEKGNIFNREPLRVRRLLMHKREIVRLKAQVKQQGRTQIVPLFKNCRLTQCLVSRTLSVTPRASLTALAVLLGCPTGVLRIGTATAGSLWTV